MATWTIRIEAEAVAVTYRVGDNFQQCGRSERVLEPDVLAWVIGQADPGDVIEIANARFVRQATFEPPRA